MSEEVKEAIIKLKHYANITTHWKQEEFTDSEINNYIKLALNYIDKLQKENFNYRVANKLLEDEAYKDGFEERKKLQKENAELKEKIKEYEIGIVKE